MDHRSAHKLVQASLAAALILGGLTILFSVVWVPAYQAVSVDVILNPEELSDRKLIEVVNRTNRHNDKGQDAVVWPFRALGALTVVAALVGLVAFRGLPPPLVRGVIGMREAP